MLLPSSSSLKKVLLLTRIGMMKNGEVFECEKADAYAKFLVAQMKSLLLPKSKDFSNEIALRHYLTTETIKKMQDLVPH